MSFVWSRQHRHASINIINTFCTDIAPTLSHPYKNRNAKQPKFFSFSKEVQVKKLTCQKVKMVVGCSFRSSKRTILKQSQGEFPKNILGNTSYIFLGITSYSYIFIKKKKPYKRLFFKNNLLYYMICEVYIYIYIKQQIRLVRWPQKSFGKF